MEQIHAAGSSVAMGPLSDGFVKSNELEAKVERLTQAMIFCGVFAVALVFFLKRETLLISSTIHQGDTSS